MTIRYLVLAHYNPAQFAELLTALEHQGSTVIVHIDQKVDDAPFRAAAGTSGNVRFIPDRFRVRVNWGGWSQVEASLSLLRFAVNGPDFAAEDRLVLLSGDSYPVQEQSVIHDYFAALDDQQFINCLPMDPATKPSSRFTRFHLEYDPHRKFMSVLPRLVNRCGVPRNHERALNGRRVYCGSQWWMLTGEAVTWILDEIDADPAFTRYCRFTRIPDEFFFHTLLADSPFTHQLKRSLMYSSWTDASGASPEVLRKRHIKDLKVASLMVNQRGYGVALALFARKVVKPKITKKIRRDLWKLTLDSA
ncbi:beta-1,6-N-acetylglucosaminyltransferase [Arthrobacter sp. TB 23]|uniref:beta-1,6-N-acetylglucosaminyltransferase n=1 Tax=Arthrobacter sp. TB 23 TaxID=494419 RepID=UPI00178C363E|nr:beta-1,6-N-acetylglucosaminyltransferase [Arthrobacter sp. TB 23]